MGTRTQVLAIAIPAVLLSSLVVLAHDITSNVNTSKPTMDQMKVDVEYTELPDGHGLIFTFESGSVFVNSQSRAAVYLGLVSHTDAIKNVLANGIDGSLGDHSPENGDCECAQKTDGNESQGDTRSRSKPRVVVSNAGVATVSKTISEVANEAAAQCVADAERAGQEAKLMDAANADDPDQPNSQVDQAIGLYLISQGVSADKLMQETAAFRTRAKATQAKIDDVAKERANRQAHDDDDDDNGADITSAMLDAYGDSVEKEEHKEALVDAHNTGWYEGYVAGSGGKTPPPNEVEDGTLYDGGLIEQIQSDQPK